MAVFSFVSPSLSPHTKLGLPQLLLSTHCSSSSHFPATSRVFLPTLAKLTEDTCCKPKGISFRDATLFAPASSSASLLFFRANRIHSGSSPLSVEDQEVLQDSSKGSPQGTVGDSAMKDKLRQAIVQLVEEDLEVATKKYNLEEELFAEIDFAQVNAFTDRPFSGNPAAVCYLPFEKDDQWLQLIAREFNLSETAFLVKRRLSKTAKEGELSAEQKQLGDGPPLNLDESGTSLKAVRTNAAPVIENEYDLRWFTPTVEVDLCGHATLASAHLLFSSAIVEGDMILFHTKSGVLKARKVSGYESDDASQEEEHDFTKKKRRPVGHGIIELDFPLVLASKCDESEAKQLSEVLGGVDTLWVGRTSLGDYLVELPCSKDVEQLKPQFNKMMDFSGRGGVIVTALAKEDSSFDFISRFFCPKCGIPEDPVTGSAHCTLAPFWADKLGKNTLEAFQASERGGKVSIRVEKSEGREGRVYLQGGAILVMAGVLLNTMRS